MGHWHSWMILSNPRILARLACSSWFDSKSQWVTTLSIESKLWFKTNSKGRLTYDTEETTGNSGSGDCAKNDDTEHAPRISSPITFQEGFQPCRRHIQLWKGNDLGSLVTFWSQISEEYPKCRLAEPRVEVWVKGEHGDHTAAKKKRNSSERFALLL